MNDEIDRELGRAIKEASAKELQGWEFTPAMRRAVHQRLAEQAIPVAEAKPTRSPRPGLIRGVAWVAVSAAALAIAFNLRGSFGPFSAADKQESHPSEIAALTEEKAADPPKAKTGAPPNTEPVASNLLMTNQGAGPKTDVHPDPPPVPPPAEIRSTDVESPGDQGTPPPEPGKADARMTLTVKEVALHQPAAVERGNPKQEHGFGIMTVPATPEVFDLLPPTVSAPARAVASAGLVVYDEAGNIVREEPVAGNAAESPVAVAADGRVAVGTRKEVHLFDASGKAVQSLSLPSEVGTMAWSADGRLAVADQSGVAIYRGGQQQARLNDQPHARLCYTADGGLAVLSESAAGRNLRLFAPDGSPLASVPVTGAGQGLAAAGEVVVVGGQAFHPDGRLAWEAPLEPVGVVALGPDGPVAAWDGSQVVLLEPAAGHGLWKAEYTAGQILKVVPSTDGQFLAILGSGGEGGAAWVLDTAGEERFAISFQSLPVDLEVANGSLLVVADGQLKRYPIK